MTAPDGTTRAWNLKLVATDLDGTLLGRDGVVTDRTRAALALARKAGITVVAVTGRPPRWLDPLADDLGPGLAVCANGAIVIDLPSGQVVEEFALEPVAAAEVVLRLRAAIDGVCFAVERNRAFGWEPCWAERMQALRRGRTAEGDERPVPAPAEQLIAPIDELVAQPVAKLLAWAQGERGDAHIERALAAVGDIAEVTASGGQELIEVSALGVSKATTLARLCERLGVAATEVVAFGDARNDVGMLTWAGWGVAVADAHPAAIEAADDITASCEHDGVADWLERHIQT